MTTEASDTEPAIHWDDDGYGEFFDVAGLHCCPSIHKTDNPPGVFVDDLEAFLTPDQARSVAARLIACADEAEAKHGDPQ